MPKSSDILTGIDLYRSLDDPDAEFGDVVASVGSCIEPTIGVLKFGLDIVDHGPIGAVANTIEALNRTFQPEWGHSLGDLRAEAIRARETGDSAWLKFDLAATPGAEEILRREGLLDD